MFLFKRAWLYVRRKWGKALIVGIILFVVSTLVLTGLLIKSASQSTFEVARDKLGADVTYTSDLSSIMESMRNSNSSSGTSERGSGGFKLTLPDDYTAVTTKEIETIASTSKYVKSYTINASLAGEPVDFAYYSPTSSSTSDSTTSTDKNAPEGMKNNASINIVGVDKQSKDTSFNSDENKIVEGRYFTDDEITNASNVVMIEKTIADLNSINVGDTITITKRSQHMPGESTSDTTTTDVNVTYKVVGIYKTSNPTDVTSSNFRGSFNLTENTMYAPYTTILASNLAGLTGDELTTAKAKIEKSGYEVQSATFSLKDPGDVSKFISEVKSMSGISTTYRSLNADDAAYEQMVGPIENVASTSTVLVIVVIIAGAFIIGLLSMLSIKDRKYELGVLLSLGEARVKIVAQLICEMLIIAIISFSLAAVVSNFTAQATTNFLLNQEIATTEKNSTTTNNQFGGNFGKGFMMGPNSKQLKNIDVTTVDTLTVKLNSVDVLEMFGIGVLIIVIGNVLQAVFVLRCNPKEILLER